MVNKENAKETEWLRLSEAAEYLGVHFTTLRRWSDAGQIPCMKTPGGRRRFMRSDLDGFLQRSRQGGLEKQLLLTKENAQPEIISEIRQLNMRRESWYKQIPEGNQRKMASHGRKLVGSLIHYAGRDQGGEQFLEQGKKLAASYGHICKRSGLSIIQTINAFVSIRHSIMDSLCEAGVVVEDSGEDTWKIYQRVNYFLDVMLVTVLEYFQIRVEEEPAELETGTL